jgi:hypothetical protein
MDARYLHDACHEAACQCPQFLGYEDDGYFPDYGEFGDIPKKGLYRTVQFWREYGHLLWEYGYEDHLPDDVKEVFENIDSVIAKSVKEYCKHFGVE